MRVPYTRIKAPEWCLTKYILTFRRETASDSEAKVQKSIRGAVVNQLPSPKGDGL